MSMRGKLIPTIKSLLIVALAALAIVQVTHLWLSTLTNRSFFIYLQARFAPSAPDGQSEFAKPYRIVYGAGDGLFDIRYSEISQSQEWLFGEAVLKTMLRRGASYSAERTSQTEIFREYPVVLCEYAFPMSAEIFTNVLGQGNLLESQGIEYFQSAAFQFVGEAVNVYFVNGRDAWKFSLPADSVGTLEIEPTDPEQLHFVRSDGDFVPRSPESGLRRGFLHTTMIIQNPFRSPQGLFTRSHIRGMVEGFFDNPAMMTPGTTVDGIYTFSTRNAMVRYLENSVLEYSSYRTIGRTASDNFMADFSAALDFLNNDSHVVNETYLRYHEQRGGRANIFWFNYVIDDQPIIFTEQWYTSARCSEPLTAPIEIIVDHGRVVRYRRIAYTFVTGELAWFNLPEEAGYMLGFPLEPASGAVVELEAVY
ncbi:MAG: hypothetical protein FWG87_02185 [Defluviitaleaceae bacterium]|nr:hypothetical protein [Defluviitaleaceae bacterium]